MRRTIVRVVGVAAGALGLLAASAVTTSNRRPAPHPAATQQPAAAHLAPTPQPSPSPLLAGARPVAANPHILGWTLLTVPDGQVLADHCPGCTNQAASTVKVWLAGDALRRAGKHPTRRLLQLVDAAILDSDNTAATNLFWNGGGRDGLWRMVNTCHLITTLPSNAWGETLITAGDLARLAACVAHGDVAGPTWTPYLLNRMRSVRGAGRFGPVDALPGADVAMKNGWTTANDQWNVNCLAIINNTWVIGIITRYPTTLDKAHGGRLCADVTRQLATPAPTATATQAEQPRA